MIGAIVCKAGKPRTKPGVLRGYIAMLVVDTAHRRKRLGSLLVASAVDKMRTLGCDEVRAQQANCQVHIAFAQAALAATPSPDLMGACCCRR